MKLDDSARVPGLALWLASAAIVAGMIAAQLHPRYAGDLWWHLWGGKQVLEHGWFSFPDHATFTQDGWTWATTEWLFQVVLLAGWRALGAHGLTAVVAGAAGATGALLCALGLRIARARPWLGLLVAAMVAAAVSGHFLARPQVAFLPLLVSLLLLLERPFDRRGVILLLLLQLVWAHSHGSHVLVAAIVACRALDHWRDGRLGLRAVGLVVAASGSISLFLGPRGPAVVADVLHHAGTDSARHVGDMRPLLWEDLVPDGLEPTTWLLVLIVFAVVRALSYRVRIGDLLLALLGLAMTITAVRFEATWAILLLPLLLRDARPVSGLLAAGERLLAATAAIVVVPATWLATATHAPHLRPGLGLWEPAYPVAAAALLESQGAQGHLYNSISDGGYLLWHLAPELQVAIDFRTPTFHSPAHHALLRQSTRSAATFQGMDAQWGIDHALVARDWPLCGRLAASPDWRAVHTDRGRVLFTRADGPLLPGFGLEALPLCAEQLGCPADGVEAAARWREVEQLAQLEPTAAGPRLERLRLLACSPSSVSPELAATVAHEALADELDAFDTARAAELLSAAGQPDAALAATERFPEDSAVLLLRGRLLWEQGDPVGASDALWHAATILDDGMMIADRRLLAQALAAAGEHERAATQAFRVAATGDRDALALLATLSPKLGPDQAEECQAWLETYGVD